MFEANYQSKKNNEKNNFFYNLDILSFFAIICYFIFTISILIKFIPISDLTWFKMGMGKYVGIASIFAILCLLYKNYFAAFFISLFAVFFSFHEIIIFYDNYAIELGKELGDDGVFRSLVDIFINEIAKHPTYGAFWAILSSLMSLLFVSLSWMKNIISENIALHDKVLKEEID